MQDLLHELQTLEAALHHPDVRSSRERLEQLLHPDFREVGRSGRRYTRETVIQYLVLEAEQPDVVASEYAMHLLAEGCALLTYQSSHREPDGTEALPTLRSSIWLRTASGWQMYYHQGTPSSEQS